MATSSDSVLRERTILANLEAINTGRQCTLLTPFWIIIELHRSRFLEQHNYNALWITDRQTSPVSPINKTKRYQKSLTFFEILVGHGMDVLLFETLFRGKEENILFHFLIEDGTAVFFTTNNIKVLEIRNYSSYEAMYHVFNEEGMRTNILKGWKAFKEFLQ